MADFSFLSDSDDDRAVGEVLSQALDQSVLEQVAAINLSGVSDSVLPTHLETRFLKLKSFPVSKSKSSSLSSDKNTTSSSFSKARLPFNNASTKPQLNNELKISVGANYEADSPFDDGNSFSSPFGGDPAENNGFKSKSSSVSGSSSPKFSMAEKGVLSPSKQDSNGKMKPSSFSEENGISLPSKQCHSDGKNRLKSKSLSRSFLTPSKYSHSSADSPSPPRRAGCFWCSPKKASRENSKENRGTAFDVDGGSNWEIDNEFLSDSRTFSMKEQQKILKKAMKEEEKISREAEKIVKWAKQASARMDALYFQDELRE